MERQKKKSKKHFPQKGEDKNRTSSFNQDLKTIKENLRISEILRNVKISSSFRVKGPKGTKVMTDAMNELADKSGTVDLEETCLGENASGNSEKSLYVDQNYKRERTTALEEDFPIVEKDHLKDEDNNLKPEDGDHQKRDTCEDNESVATYDNVPLVSMMETCEENCERFSVETKNELPPSEGEPQNASQSVDLQISTDSLKPLEDIYEASATLPRKPKDFVNPNRKLSLDNTMLRANESLSKSEMNLNTVGKYPLQRKSSFFRKKLDSFVKNTSEVFKRQTSRQCNGERSGSTSFSLQSLTDKNVFMGDVLLESKPKRAEHGSSSSVDRESLMSSVGSLADSQSQLDSSVSSTKSSMHSLNELYVNDAILAGRAFSYSSGLDTVHKPRRSQSSRNNRFTWLASDTVAEYLRRRVEAESGYQRREEDDILPHDLHLSHSFQDFSRLADAVPPRRTDSKGRRLSYQRAVSGEDPVLPGRHDSSFRRRHRISEEAELAAQANRELTLQLAEFTRNGVPPLKGFKLADVKDDAIKCVQWAEEQNNLELVTDWSKLEPNEASRQAVIRELISTEAGYILHLKAIVDVFMATAHALQDNGKLLMVDTQKLFSNIPDVLNASIYFWSIAIYPMVQAAIENNSKYNTELMYPGFFAFREIFTPYERYVSDQNIAIDYLRTLNSDNDFMTYLNWCHRHTACNRLQLADMLVKPMQRLTKYNLILGRIIQYTGDEEERAALMAMKACVKNYVLELNRTMRQKEELDTMDHLAENIDGYEVDYKDEDMDRLYRMYTNVNLKAPMVGCLPNHNRTLVYEGDLRFKDSSKEQKIDVRAVLLTDMLLITKKASSKVACFPLKMIRPKYMVDRIMHFPQFKNPKNCKEMSSIVCVVLDEVGSAYTCFSLCDAKDSGTNNMKIWEQKIREAKLSYDLAVWFAKHPNRDLSELDPDNDPKPGMRPNSDEVSVEREARERVATMLHRNMGHSTEHEYSFTSMHTDSLEGESGWSGTRAPGILGQRFMMKRASTGGSSRNSRLSSFQQSTSAASHDEPLGVGKYSFRCGSSVEHLIVPPNPEDDTHSITVNVIDETETPNKPQPPIPTYASIPSAPRSPSSIHHMLKVQPQCGVMALVHSLPDLSVDPSLRMQQYEPNISIKMPSPAIGGPMSASDALYQAHAESLSRHRLSARPATSSGSSSHFLSPDHRGTSYPPPSPTRASLRRGLAFSHSMKNPPLAKMGHVKSESQQPPPEQGAAGGGAGPGGGGGGMALLKPSPSLYSKQSTSAMQHTGEKGAVNPVLVGATEKKSKGLSSRSSKGSRSVSPSPKGTD